jgi:hypothetical protein
MFGWFKKKETPSPSQELVDQLHEANTRNLRLSVDLQQANTAIAGLKTERDSLQAKVREQNEADLLLVSMRIQQRILAGEKKEALRGDIALQQQLMAMSQSQNPWNGGLGNAGLMGAIFGPQPWQMGY